MILVCGDVTYFLKICLSGGWYTNIDFSRDSSSKGKKMMYYSLPHRLCKMQRTWIFYKTFDSCKQSISLRLLRFRLKCKPSKKRNNILLRICGFAFNNKDYKHNLKWSQIKKYIFSSSFVNVYAIILPLLR